MYCFTGGVCADRGGGSAQLTIVLAPSTERMKVHSTGASNRRPACEPFETLFLTVSRRHVPIARSLHRHRLRQIPRLVDVGAAYHGRVICKKLQRNRMQDRRQMSRMLRQADHMYAFAR